MKVGITGAFGFVGWHLRCALLTETAVTEVRCAGRDDFADKNRLQAFVSDLDYILHVAGVNRADSDSEIETGNLQPARDLNAALDAVESNATIIYFSTTHALEPNTVYGRAKRDAGKLLARAAEGKRRFVSLIIPHVFGEYGRPFYNSGVNTFCHQIVNGEDKLSINPDGHLNLLHVQELADRVIECLHDKETGERQLPGFAISVPEVVERLQYLYHSYVSEGVIPDLESGIDCDLFNTLRGAIPVEQRKVSLTQHQDERGWLVETLRSANTSHCFVSGTHPGYTRGNHYHRRKVERFLVLKGEAVIRLRRLFSAEIIEYRVSGDTPSFVDIPTLHTHNISNVGDTELMTFFWTNEFFDRERPDTYAEEV